SGVAAGRRSRRKGRPAIIAAEKTNVAESKKNANAVGCRRKSVANGTADGMCDAATRRSPNRAAAIGIEPYEEARISPFASSSESAGARSGTLASRAGRKKSERHSWTKASA